METLTNDDDDNMPDNAPNGGPSDVVAAPRVAAAAPAEPIFMFGLTSPELISIASKGMLGYLAFQFITGNSPLVSHFLPKASDASPVVGGPVSEGGVPGFAVDAVPKISRLLWPIGTEMDMTVVFSTSEDGNLDDVFSASRTKNVEWFTPALHFPNITLGDWDDERAEDVILRLPESVQNNGSVWLDIFVVKGGTKADPESDGYVEGNVARQRKRECTPVERK